MYADQEEKKIRNSGVGPGLLKSTGLLNSSNSSSSNNRKRLRNFRSNGDTIMNDNDSNSSRRSAIRNKSNPLARPSTSSRPKKVSINNSSNTSVGNKPNKDKSAIEILTRFLQSRFDPSLSYLNLENMGDDHILKSNNFVPPGYSKQKSLVGPSMFKLVSELFPDIKTISLASNKLRSLTAFKSLAQYVPHLQNLSLSDNDLRHFDDMIPLCTSTNKLKHLKELILTNNPMTKSGDAYRSAILKRFPSLEMLDMKPITKSVKFDLGDGVQVDPKKIKKRSKASSINLPTQFPIGIQGSFGRDNGEVGPLVGEFLTRFFSCFDKDRISLGSVYTDKSTFSLSVNVNVPPKARKDETIKYNPKLNWKPFLDNDKPIANSRNCARSRYNDIRNEKLSVGVSTIIEAQSYLPQTEHNISNVDKFVFDCWTMPGVLPSTPIIFCVVHGEYIEYPSKGSRSFDRSFVLAPASASKIAVDNGWPCVILSDQLTIRSLSNSNAWKVGPISTYEEKQGFYKALPKEPPSNINKDQHKLIIELCKITRLNYNMSIECLNSNQWNLDLALQNFEQVKQSIPADAYI